jgi:hypothetical protein
MSVLRNCPTNCSLVDEYSLQKPVAIRFSKSRRGVTVHGRVISIHVHDLFMVTSKPFEMRVLWEEITIKASRDAYALLLLSTIDDTDVQPTWGQICVRLVFVVLFFLKKRERDKLTLLYREEKIHIATHWPI